MRREGNQRVTKIPNEAPTIVQKRQDDATSTYKAPAIGLTEP